MEDRKKRKAQMNPSNIKKRATNQTKWNTNWSLLCNSWKVVVYYTAKPFFIQRAVTSCFICSDSAHKAVLAVCSQVAAFPISRFMCSCFPILIFSQRAPLAFLQQICSYQEPGLLRIFFFIIVNTFNLERKSFSSISVEKTCACGKATAAGTKLSKTSLQCSSKQISISC